MSKKIRSVLQFLPKGGGFLRDPDRSFQPGSGDAWVSSKLIRQYGLAEGADVSGEVAPGKKGLQLVSVESVCDLSPEEFQNRPRFDRLVAIDPTERFGLGFNKNKSMRVVELISPIGKGTRGLIVAPPRTGKTQMLEEIANAIHASEPDSRIVVLLIDERPEEVTHFRRNVKAEVLASSNDQSIKSHVSLAEMTLAHVRCELECGRDVVVLVDSLTRMTRAFNKQTNSGSRTLTGGLDVNALEIPRRFFGLARNIENGGSVTVIATALIETGSRMDDFIFEEFKGTGNSEIVLDRSLADERLFPAINIKASSTRKEELLYTEDKMKGLVQLRRALAGKEPKPAMEALLKLINETENNDALLKQINSKL